MNISFTVFKIGLKYNLVTALAHVANFVGHASHDDILIGRAGTLFQLIKENRIASYNLLAAKIRSRELTKAIKRGQDLIAAIERTNEIKKKHNIPEGKSGLKWDDTTPKYETNLTVNEPYCMKDRTRETCMVALHGTNCELCDSYIRQIIKTS